MRGVIHWTLDTLDTFQRRPLRQHAEPQRRTGDAESAAFSAAARIVSSTCGRVSGARASGRVLPRRGCGMLLIAPEVVRRELREAGILF